MPRVYLDPSAINKLVDNPNLRKMFVVLSPIVEFTSSAEVLQELVATPEKSRALACLDCCVQLTRMNRITVMPSAVIAADFIAFRESKPAAYLMPEKEARAIIDDVMRYVKEGEVEKLRSEIYGMKKNFKGIDIAAFKSVHENSEASPAGKWKDFSEFWRWRLQKGEFVESIRKASERLKLRTGALDAEQAKFLLYRLPDFRAIYSYLRAIDGLQYARGVAKVKPKWGDSFDMRHLIVAANDDFLITEDQDLLAFVEMTGPWPFKAVTLEEFLRIACPPLS